MTYQAPGWRMLAAVAVAALAGSALLAFSRPVEMTVDGEHVESDVPPVTAANDIFVPVRSIADALGAQTFGVGSDGRIEIVRGKQSLMLRLGDRHAKVGGAPFTLAHSPFRVRGRVMVELAAVAGAFDVRATFDPRTSRIDVLTPGIGQATVPKTATQTQ